MEKPNAAPERLGAFDLEGHPVSVYIPAVGLSEGVDDGAEVHIHYEGCGQDWKSAVVDPLTTRGRVFVASNPTNYSKKYSWVDAADCTEQVRGRKAEAEAKWLAGRPERNARWNKIYGELRSLGFTPKEARNMLNGSPWHEVAEFADLLRTFRKRKFTAQRIERAKAYGAKSHAENVLGGGIEVCNWPGFLWAAERYLQELGVETAREEDWRYEKRKKLLW